MCSHGLKFPWKTCDNNRVFGATSKLRSKPESRLTAPVGRAKAGKLADRFPARTIRRTEHITIRGPSPQKTFHEPNVPRPCPRRSPYPDPCQQLRLPP